MMGERVELVLEPGRRIPLRVVQEEADGWVTLTTELEYEHARLKGKDPEPLLRARSDQIEPAP